MPGRIGFATLAAIQAAHRGPRSRARLRQAWWRALCFCDRIMRTWTKLSRTVQYALVALAQLNYGSATPPTAYDDLLKSGQLPENYLKAILHTLIARGAGCEFARRERRLLARSPGAQDYHS
jgi:hypothetical protein